MTQTITIDPVTRIEGHSKITLFLDDAGEVHDAQFHVTQFRGFELLSEGRPFREMPSLMARICGICPISHLIASAKACDELLAVRIPETAVKLRQMVNLAQMVQSHALSFFYLSSPDLLLGMDSNPDNRHIFGVAQAHPEMARGGVKLRQFGQRTIEILAGKRIHPAWIVPGGVTEPLTADRRDQILAMIPEAKQFILNALTLFKARLHEFADEIRTFANFPTLHMGLVTKANGLEFYDGDLRIIGADGKTLVPAVDKYHYQEVIGEAVEPYSYLKSPYYKPRGYPNGMYRVGPLSRLNIVSHAGTLLADQELAQFKALPDDQRQSSFHYHYARLIEMLFGVERIEQLLHEPDILSTHVHALASPNAYEGVGISEAPRGTLLHHYKIDDDGLIRYVNLIIATGNNNLAMNKGVLQVAQHYIHGGEIKEGALNRVEAVIRAFDPCLSCSTHAIGQMPLHIELVAPDGTVVNEVKRG
ncbi:MAG: Ni/Fe hydrogenase subunit alpha [Phototrophicales bacterium]|nr:MAG: Ni/Fe hydrogenase subunit alpha [Phototrophicales bacterium]